LHILHEKCINKSTEWERYSGADTELSLHLFSVSPCPVFLLKHSLSMIYHDEILCRAYFG